MGTPLASAFAGGMMSGSIPQCSYAPSGAVRGTPAWISSKIRDRESGGWGKRVDFGGGRVIKKKKKKGHWQHLMLEKKRAAPCLFGVIRVYIGDPLISWCPSLLGHVSWRLSCHSDWCGVYRVYL